jgi:hypothetical protein
MEGCISKNAHHRIKELVAAGNNKDAVRGMKPVETHGYRERSLRDQGNCRAFGPDLVSRWRDVYGTMLAGETPAPHYTRQALAPTTTP